jgi:calcineurin-like phosphoesterase family protein
MKKGTIKMNTYFTSDLHFGHKNIISFDDRPFKSIEEMDSDLIKRWNNKVRKKDLVYVLGDMIWRNNDYATNILKQLNGRIILIKGNHDKWINNTKNKELLVGIKDYDEIEVILKDGSKKRCVLSHYPIHFYNGHYNGAVMLYGHVHNTREMYLVKQISEQLNSLEPSCLVCMYNVGSMLWNYEPVTLDEILGQM